MKKLVLLMAAMIVLASCGGDEDGSEAGEKSPHGFPTAPAILEGDDGSEILTVEVAETDEQRQRGLMHRESLPEDHGMVFMYFAQTSGSFWMKDTLIPLSIAFFDAEGTILKILDMEPCETKSCPVYDPGVAYWGALEVNQGSFEDWNIKEGDRITISR